MLGDYPAQGYPQPGRFFDQGSESLDTHSRVDVDFRILDLGSARAFAGTPFAFVFYRVHATFVSKGFGIPFHSLPNNFKPSSSGGSICKSSMIIVLASRAVR